MVSFAEVQNVCMNIVTTMFAAGAVLVAFWLVVGLLLILPCLCLYQAGVLKRLKIPAPFTFMFVLFSAFFPTYCHPDWIICLIGIPFF